MGFFDRMLGGFGMGHHGGRSGGHHGRRGYQEYDNRSDYPPNRPAAATATACVKCGGQNQAGTRFCERCGASLTAAPCGACGAELAPGVKFCGQCGRPT